MSEPSGDSPNTPPSSEPEPTGAGASPNNLARAPRAKPPNVNSSKEVPPTGSPPGFSEFMTWMKMMGEGNAVDNDASQPGRGVLPKEQKKFSRRTTEPPASSPSPDVRSMAPGIAPPSSPQAERTSPGAPVNVPPDFLNVERKRRSRDTSNKSPSSRC